MKTTSLALLLIAGGAIGLALPTTVDEREAAGVADPAASSTQAPAASRAKPADAPWPAQAILERSHDGHFYADVFINGAQTRMLVDTGASAVALTGADAASMGIHWNYSDLSVVAQGANGPVEGVHVRLPEVEMADFLAHDVAAIIVPEGLSVSLLGQSFLATVKKVEIADGQMVLSN